MSGDAPSGGGPTRPSGISRQGEWANRQRAAGLCRCCTSPARPGRAFCRRHLLYKSKMAAKYRRARAKGVAP
jgi:hypothetical protein